MLCLAAELSMVTLLNVLYGNIQGGVHIMQNVFNLLSLCYMTMQCRGNLHYLSSAVNFNGKIDQQGKHTQESHTLCKKMLK